MKGQQVFTVTPINPQGRQWIQVEEAEWSQKYGVKTSSKRGFIEVQPEKAQEALAAYQSGELFAVLGSYNRQNTLYEISTVVAAEEPATVIEVSEGTLAH